MGHFLGLWNKFQKFQKIQKFQKPLKYKKYSYEVIDFERFSLLACEKFVILTLLPMMYPKNPAMTTFSATIPRWSTMTRMTSTKWS